MRNRPIACGILMFGIQVTSWNIFNKSKTPLFVYIKLFLLCVKVLKINQIRPILEALSNEV